MTSSPPPLPLTRSSVLAAHEKIQPHIHKTPVLTSFALNAIISTPQTSESLIGTPWEGQTPVRPKINLFFKCENFQKIGAFKIRGATHALSRLSKEELERGVVTHSSGNHAQALSLAARQLNTTAHVIMPTISKPSKIAATKSYGAHVYFSGSTSQEREALTKEVISTIAKQNGGGQGPVMIPPYDHPNIILGQGTMALELESQVTELISNNPTLSVRGAHSTTPNESKAQSNGAQNRDLLPNGSKPHPKKPGQLDALIAPLGGGGMLSGIATALSPTPTLIFGAEPSLSGADDGRRGLLQNKRIDTVSSLTIADGLRTPVGEINWTIISDKSKVEGVFSVTEEQIKEAMRLVMERLKVVVEPSAVVGFAVGLFDEGFRRQVPREGWDLGVVLSGGNVSVEGLVGLFGEQEEKEGGLGGGVEREEGKVGMDGGRVAENVPG